MTSLRQTAGTLAIGAAGAAAALLIGLPVAPLIGGALATSAAAWAGLSLGIDARLRDLGFLVIGLSLGSGFNADILSSVGDWSISIAMLCLSVWTTIVLSRWLLVRYWRIDRQTALLASAPGTLSLALSLASDGRGDPVTVVVLQSLRLLMLAAAVPLLVAGAKSTPVSALRGPEFGLPALALTLILGLAIAWGLKRLRFPAAYLLGGMAASAAGHISGLVHGLPPAPFLVAGFCITGSVVGSRFSGMTLKAILAHASAAVVTVGTAAMISAGFAGLTCALTGLPVASLWIAFAPGGVETMAAIGLALEADPAFIALHHLIRISFLIVLLPLMTRAKTGTPVSR